MKTIKLLLVLCFLVCSIPLFSQTERSGSDSEQPPTQYKRCLDGMARWSLFVLDISDGNVQTSDIYAYGDSVFNNTVYKKMYIYGFNYLNSDSSDTYWQNNSLQNWSYYYYGLERKFIRESEDASKLFLYDSSSGVETLFSDMDLDIGDEFDVGGIFSNLMIVDSVFYKDGLKHIRFENSFYLNSPLYFIEGVGPSWNFYFPSSLNYVHCFQNQAVFYKNKADSWLGNCACGYAFPTSVPTVQAGDYQAFKRDGQLIINFIIESYALVSLFSADGKLFYTKCFSERQAVIPIENLAQGVYIIKVVDVQANKTFVKKIIL